MPKNMQSKTTSNIDGTRGTNGANNQDPERVNKALSKNVRRNMTANRFLN